MHLEQGWPARGVGRAAHIHIEALRTEQRRAGVGDLHHAALEVRHAHAHGRERLVNRRLFLTERQHAGDERAAQARRLRHELCALALGRSKGPDSVRVIVVRRQLGACVERHDRAVPSRDAQHGCVIWR